MLSQEALLAQLIPNVFIDGITLETSGEEPLIDNPHIDDERENSEKLRSQQTQLKPLRAVVDISIKEILDNQLIGEWFREQGFQKYLKIAVVKTTSKNLISLFSESQYMINIVSEGTSVLGSGEWTLSEDEIQRLIEATGKDSQWEAGQYLSQNMEVRVLSASLDSLGGLDAVSSPTTLDSDGNTIKDYIYRVVFQHQSQPSELAVFAVSYLDLQALKSDYDLDFEQGTLENQNGKVASEYIIQNNQVVSESNVYLISEGQASGQVWSGPVHEPEAGSYATGSEPSVDSKKLVKRTITNSKVQDFRQVDEIYKYQIPERDLRELGFSSNQKVILSNDKIFAEENNIHFTNLWLSRDSNGAARFMFGVDILSLVRHNSLFGNLLRDDTEAVRSIISRTKVKTIKVLRRRVKNHKTLNKLGIPVQAEILFDKKEPYEALVFSGSNSSQLEEVTNPSSSIREAHPIVSDDPIGMKYFTVHDRQMSEITDGIYQYGIQIQVEDGVVNHLESTALRLSELRRELSEYLLHANKLGMTKKILEINDPHIDDSRERYASSIMTAGHYDPTTNRFTDKFIDFCEQKYANDVYPWIEAPVVYHAALVDISENSGGRNFSSVMSSVMAPHSGTPKGIMTVIDLYDKLISKYNKLIGKNVYSGVRTSAVDKTISKEYWFQNDLFDSNVDKKSGLDYLSDIAERQNATNKVRYQDSMPMSEYSELAYGNSQTRGLKIIDGGYWQSRINTEVLKYFADENPDLTISSADRVYSDSSLVSVSSYGFLSPSYVISAGQAYSLTLDRDSSYYSNIGLGLVEANASIATLPRGVSSTTRQTDEEATAQTRYQSLFSDFNVVVSPLPSYDTNLPSALDNRLVIEALDGCTERQLDPVDPYPAWTESDDGRVSSIYSQEQNYKFGYANANFIDFFKKAIEFVFTDNARAGNMPPTLAEQMKVGIGTYSLSNDSNFLDLIQTNVQMRNAIANSIGAPQGASASQVITLMPNQLKSLVLLAGGSSIVRPAFDLTMIDPIVDWQSSAKFVLNYEFLASIERFDGFIDDDENPSAIKKERWVPLTEEYFRASAGQELLCRIKQYQCSELGQTFRRYMQAPVYDKYFLLKPPVTATSSFVRVSIYDTIRTQLLTDWSIGLQKISKFATTNLITGA